MRFKHAGGKIAATLASYNLATTPRGARFSLGPHNGVPLDIYVLFQVCLNCFTVVKPSSRRLFSHSHRTDLVGASRAKNATRTSSKPVAPALSTLPIPIPSRHGSTRRGEIGFQRCDRPLNEGNMHDEFYPVLLQTQWKGMELGISPLKTLVHQSSSPPSCAIRALSVGPSPTPAFASNHTGIEPKSCLNGMG